MLDTPTIVYQNIRGLNWEKLNYFSNLIHTHHDSPTIAILAEHWFPKKHQWYEEYQFYKESNLLLAESRTPTTARKHGHENGGLVLIGNSQSKQLVYNITKETHYLYFHFGHLRVAAVYLPPSLSDQEVKTILASIPNDCNTVIGDINVRFGTSFDDIATHPGRRQAILTWASERRLQHVKPSQGKCKTDHLFTSVKNDFQYLATEINSDHGRMKVTFIQDQEIRTESLAQPVRKYALKKLQDAKTQKALKSRWSENITVQITNLIRAAQVSIEEIASQPNSRQKIRAIADGMYAIFTDQIYGLCDEYLPQYRHTDKPKQGKQRNYEEEIGLITQHDKAVRLFKESQRGATVDLRSRDPNKTPLEEAYNHYNGIFGTRLPEFNNEPKEVDYSFLNDDCFDIRPMVIPVTKRYPSCKSGGPDQIHTLILKVLIQNIHFAKALQEMLQFFLTIGTTPTAWNESTVCLLVKSKDEPFADKTRPISLTQIIRRIFESCYLRTIFKAKMKWAETSSIQFGFKTGFGVTSQVINAHETTLLGYTKCSFLDIKGAYDRVPHCRLMNVLTEKGLPKRDLSIILSLMVENVTSTIVSNGVAHPIPVEKKRGLFQGSILSPLLFNLFIDPLARALEASKEDGISASLLFADDIKVATKTHQEHQRLVTLCSEWARTNGMHYGIAKCGTMGDDNEVFLGDEAIPKVKEYKYLGAIHKVFGIDFHSTFQKQFQKYEKFAKALRWSAAGWPYWIRLHIAKTFLMPLLEYLKVPIHIGIMKSRDNVKMKQYMEGRQEARKLLWQTIFNNDNIKGQKALESITGIWSLEEEMEYTAARLQIHLESLSDDNQVKRLRTNGLLALHKQSIINLCFNSKLLKSFRQSSQPKQDQKEGAHTPGPNQLDPKSKLPSMRTWTKKLQLANLKKQRTEILPYYIDDCQRNSAFVDIAFQKDNEVAHKAIQWRLNKLFQGRICSVCKKRFNRGHIQDCKLLDGHPATAQLQKDPRFTRYLTSLKAQLAWKQNWNEKNFTILDFALNTKKIGTFTSLATHIESRLAS